MAAELQVVQAFDRAPIETLPADDAAALERKLTAARDLFAARQPLPAWERGAILQRTARIVSAERDALAQLIAREGGKPLVDARVEVVRAVDGLENAAQELRSAHGREVPMGLSTASRGRWAFTTREPIGPVAALSAFNHPLNLIVHQVAPAVAVGCPVIIKPAPATPLCCLRLVALLRQAGLPEAWCQTLITADNALAERLAIDPRIAFVSFIGSAKVGWMLRSKLPPGTRCALEHGGAAPVIVDASAAQPTAVSAIVKGGYYHAGQVCVSVQRIYVQRDIFADFVAQLGDRVTALRVGDPLLADTEVGPLIRPAEVDRVHDWTAAAVAGGARLVGGGRLSPTTLAPAVLVEPPADAQVSRQEVFGPVTCVYSYGEMQEAVAAANALPFGFQASVFAGDIARALAAARDLDAAAVLVNDHTAFRTDWMPFAGRQQAGYGVGGIPASMHEMTQEKMVVLRHA